MKTFLDQVGSFERFLATEIEVREPAEKHQGRTDPSGGHRGEGGYHHHTPGGEEISWSPRMGRGAAESWVEGSAWTADVFHVTGDSGAAGIESEGFDFQQEGLGRLWGEGAYVALDGEARNFYQDLSAADTSSPQTLSLKIRLQNPLRVDFAAEPYRESDNEKAGVARRMLALVPAGDESSGITPAFERRRDDLMGEGVSRYSADAQALRETLLDHGYDGLLITGVDPDDPGAFAGIGGNQAVVFQRENVVVVDPEFPVTTNELVAELLEAEEASLDALHGRPEARYGLRVREAGVGVIVLWAGPSEEFRIFSRADGSIRSIEAASGEGFEPVSLDRLREWLAQQANPDLG